MGGQEGTEGKETQRPPEETKGTSSNSGHTHDKGRKSKGQEAGDGKPLLPGIYLWQLLQENLPIS